MTSIITADIHLNDKPVDSYRWGLLPWIKEQVKAYDDVFILGDCTDSKDRHSAVVVNRFAEHLEDLAKSDINVWILKGNHDYLDPEYPFFEFTKMIPGVNFIHSAQEVEIGKKWYAFLPATNDWEKDWGRIDFINQDYIFCHATFTGALSENGTQLSGISPSIFAGTKAKIYAGDIHVPQKVGPVEYVGAPYRTRFGDNFNPRCVILDDSGRARDLHFPCPSKFVLTIRTLRDLDKELRQCERGDAVKVRVRLLRSEYAEWPQMRAEIKDLMKRRGMELVGPEIVALEAAKREEEPEEFKRVDPSGLVRRYGRRERVDKRSMEIGLNVLKELL